MSSGTDKIVSSIMSEAQGKADVIIQDANAEVSAINAKAEKTAEIEKTKILENGKKQSEMRYQQIISEAKMNARRAELGAKEEVIEAAFAKATDELKAIASSDGDQYDDALTRMIKEAADELGSNDVVLQMNEKDTKKFKDQLGSSGVSTFQIEDVTFELGEPIDTIGGAILKTSNGDIEVNNTIESRLDRFKSVLRSEVANVLFK
jgi:V/A-type H+-transporting ATPase subunit E